MENPLVNLINGIGAAIAAGFGVALGVVAIRMVIGGVALSTKFALVVCALIGCVFAFAGSTVGEGFGDWIATMFSGGEA